MYKIVRHDNMYILLLYSHKRAPLNKAYSFVVSKMSCSPQIRMNAKYKEIQNGAAAKSYMRKGFQIYEEMRKPLVIYDFPAAPSVFPYM